MVLEKSATYKVFLIPGAVEFSNRLMEGLDRLREMHDILPNPLMPGNEKDLE